jgi:hypothetical protein
MAALTVMAHILRRQLLERGLDPPSEKDCEAIVSAMFDGASKLDRIIKMEEAPSIVTDAFATAEIWTKTSLPPLSG